VREIQFRKALAARQEKVKSLLCVGLDPVKESVPAHILTEYGKNEAQAIKMHMIQVADATAQYTSMFKPQRGFWEAIPNGETAMRGVIAYIQTKYPDIPVFLDCKRGDIDRTQEKYREAHFSLDGVDGMNYNGYMGPDTLKSLVDQGHLGRALVGLGRTSNKAAWHVQDRLLADGRKFWEAMVEDIRNWSREFGVSENAGVVMGAAHKDVADETRIYSDHLKKAREIVENELWFLIPGIGKQGGFIGETVKTAYTGSGSIAINVSSAICLSDDPARDAKWYRDAMNDSLPVAA
jgi:orotidine 5'-phosphate decarboxylase subfamily 2